MNDSTLNGHAPDLDDIVFYNNVESFGEELDGDEEDRNEEDGDQDGGDYFIRGLDEAY